MPFPERRASAEKPTQTRKLKMKKLALMSLATTLATSFALAEEPAAPVAPATPASAIVNPTFATPRRPNGITQQPRMTPEQRRVDYLRKRAKSCAEPKLEKWEKDAAGATLELVKKCAEARQKLGATMTQLADAVEKKDAAAVGKLEADLISAEVAARTLEFEKQGAKRIVELDAVIAKFPESKELAALKPKLQSNTDEFVSISRESFALNERRMKNSKEYKLLDAQIDIVKRQAKLAQDGAK